MRITESKLMEQWNWEGMEVKQGTNGINTNKKVMEGKRMNTKGVENNVMLKERKGNKRKLKEKRKRIKIDGKQRKRSEKRKR